jgi:hypothetical protein
LKQIEDLVGRKDIRSADRANLKTMLAKLRQGQALTYQERQNLWAYIVRYDRGRADNRRP